MTAAASCIRRAVGVRGVVQGVGFRPFVFALAERHGLRGFVRNVAGEVEAEVEGGADDVAAFVRGIREEAPPLAAIAAVDVRELPARGDETTFTIRESEAREGGFRPVSPDAATCDACLRELLDPADRRHRYPFINCTHCGPRFTIIDDLPYDRPKTSMAGFPLCETCRREYEDPRDRRFHAQPVACPACGPQVVYRAAVPANGTSPPVAGEAALQAAARCLHEGGILALRGLGGFQLACDAADEDAVRRLRERKRRYGKPLAVMVPDLAAARALADLSDEEERALLSRARPIVLARRREGAAVAPSIAPGLGTIGVMLPYTPLHHLLARDLGRALVMTSGNLSEEPIATGNDEALQRLAGIADGFLLHDREIRARYDDSVVRAIGPHVTPIRRARGLAPAPIALAFDAAGPVLAVGAHQKSAFCLVAGRHAYVSQHVGDLENAETLAAFREALATYRRLFRIAPRAVAHDLHPDYLSTLEATRIAADEGLPLVPVQHHHAHLVSCLAEHGREGKAVGLIFDGSGLGPDGAIWGGEVLAGDAASFVRCGHLAPVRLPGGALAIRRPDRMALAHLLACPDAPGPTVAHAARRLSSVEARIVRHQVATGFHAPWTTSAGRLFDAAAALLDLGPEARYEGELACRLEALADEAPAGREGELRLPAGLAGSGTAADPVVMRPGALLVALVAQIAAGADRRVLARAFHDAVADLAAAAAARVAAANGIGTVVLSGGCFQNRRLAEGCRERLERAGLEVLAHRLVPPNDGGIALGQAVIANAARAGGGEGSGGGGGGGSGAGSGGRGGGGNGSGG